MDAHQQTVDGTGVSSGAGAWPLGGATRSGRDEDPRLTAARDVSDLIAEAKHRLMRDHGLGPDEAFELLRHYSRTCDLPMRDVARKLVHDTWLPGPTG